MLRIGLANIGLGIVIALVGAVITAVSYSMVGSGGGTYVVAYGAIIVGAWRVLLGLFQLLRGVLRGTLSSPEAGGAIPQSPRVTSTGPLPADALRSTIQEASVALHLVGWLLIGQAALRIFSLGSLLWRMRVPFDALFDNLPFLFTAIALPALFIAGGVAAGTLLLRNRPAAVPFGIGFCVASLLFQAYGLWRIFMLAFRVPWLNWVFVSIYLTISIVSLVILVRTSNRRTFGAAAPIGPADVPASPGMRP